MPAEIIWNWQQHDWPEFRHESGRLATFEAEFLRESGVFIGAVKHVADDDRRQLTVEMISQEALNTSEIEGERLNRDSLVSSIRRNFGLDSDHRRVPPAERGIAQMMVESHRQFSAPLTHELLYRWHGLLMKGRRRAHASK